MRIQSAVLSFVIAVAAVCGITDGARADDEKPIEIAAVKHDGPVDFEKEILPIFRRNCLACHNSTEAESDLVLETPAAIVKGGSDGPSVVPGKGAESLLLKLAARQQESFMPPDDNDVGAKQLTPQQLGLIQLWIDQGAKGEVRGTAAAPEWQPLPQGVNPIYAVGISPDGQYVAAGRANQIFLYHAPSKRELGRLTDPALMESKVYDKPGVAFFDLVQSIAFSPDNMTMAAGGFRTVKLFQRARDAKQGDLAGIEKAHSVATSADGKWAAYGEESGKIKLVDLSKNQVVKTLEGHTAAVSGVAFFADNARLVSGSQDKTFRVWNLADGTLVGEPVTGPAAINAVAIVGEQKQIATGDADNKIRIWDIAAVEPKAAADEKPAEGEEAAAAAPQPVKELAGHGGPVTALAVAQANGSQLVSGSQDQTARHWDVTGAKQIRSLAHGGPVVPVAVRGDFQRIASASSNGAAKLWNAADGKQLAEIKGDFRKKIGISDAERATRLAKRRVDLATADLKGANDRKKAEEDNKKKADEALKKAQEEYKKKEEAAKKPVADKAAADKKLADAQAAEKTATETQTKATADQKAATDAVTAATNAAKKAATDATAATQAAQKAATEAKNAANALDTAVKAVEAATKALEGDAENADKKNALAAAEKQKAEAETKNTAAQQAKTDADAKAKVAGEAKTKADQALTDAQAKKKAADAAKVAADQAVTKSQQATKTAMAEQKKAADAATKATDEQNAAKRAQEASERTVTRAVASVKKATDEIPVVEAEKKKEEEQQTATNQALEAAKKLDAESLKPLRTIAFSADGALLAVAGDDQMVHTFDSEAGAAVDTFHGHAASIGTVTFTADNRLISTADDNAGAIWDPQAEWKLVKTIGNMDEPGILVDRVTALAFSHDGKLLATGSGEPSRSGELKIWNVADGKLVREVKDPHSDTIFAIEFSPDNQYVASCGADRFMKVFKTADGSFVRSFEGHTHHVLGVSWSADGRTLATGGADKVIKVWNFLTGDQSRTISGFSKEITSIRFIAETLNVVASCGDKNVHLKRADNGGNIRALSGGTDYMYTVSASADGKVFAGGGQDSVLHIWTDAGAVIATFAPPQPEQTAAAEAK